MKTKLHLITLFLISSWQIMLANDSLTRIAVYEIKSEVLPEAFTYALSDHIESKLLGYSFYRVIARSNIDVLITEDHLLQSGVMSEEEQLLRNGSLSAIDKICTGSVSRVGKNFSFTLKIIDVRSGRIDAAAQRMYDGPEEGLLGIGSSLVGQLCRRPGTLPPVDTGKTALQTTLKAENKSPATSASTDNRIVKEVKAIDTIHIQQSARTAMQPEPAALTDRKQPKSGRDHKPSNLGKQISIGAVVIFVTLATLLVISRH